MRRHDTYVELILPTVLVFVMGLGGSSFVLADESLASSPTVQEEKGAAGGAGEIQERAVPRMGSPMSGLPQRPPSGETPMIKGLARQGNRLTAMPGFVLEIAPEGTVSARPATGGPAGEAQTCHCTETMHGFCEVQTKGNTVDCVPMSGAPCIGSCYWSSGRGATRGSTIYGR